MLSKRKKVDEKFRAFKVEWENNFVFVNHLGRPTCLIFTEAIALNKECFLISSRVCFYVFGVRDLKKFFRSSGVARGGGRVPHPGCHHFGVKP